MINISGLDKADVLAELYNHTHAQGLGLLNFDSTPMSKEEAQSLLDQGWLDFDYLKGRVMKVDLSKDEFDPWGYDRDNYQGAAQDVIDELRNKKGNHNE